MPGNKGNRPSPPGQRQTQNPMPPSSPGVSSPEREEEEEEESGLRREEEEESTAVRQDQNPGSSNRGSPGNQGHRGPGS